MEMKKAKTLAVAGKGGVGKTSISATMVRLLVQRWPQARILAIDADPAVGLCTALGVTVERTLDDIRKEVSARVAARGSGVSDILQEVRGELLRAMEHKNGFDFFAIGRPETAGCYCAVNTYLRQVIELLLDEYDYVVIDGEAGIEQVNRRVMEQVTHLVLVSDASRKGMAVVRSIKAVADELVMYERTGVIVNRVSAQEDMQYVDAGGIDILAVIAEDTELAEFDILGENVFDLPEDSKVVTGTRQALEKLGIV